MAVLTLNKSYSPINILGNHDAIRLLFREAARPTEVGPEIVDQIIPDKNIITYGTTHGIYIFNDIIVADTLWWSRKKPPYPSRSIIWKRDGHRCCYCGAFCKDPTIDHVHPVSKGGKNTYKNLVTACIKCNRKKADKTLTQFLEDEGLYMRYQPRVPAVDNALYWLHTKPHWEPYLFF